MALLKNGSDFGTLKTPTMDTAVHVSMYNSGAAMLSFYDESFGERDYIILAESIGLTVSMEEILGERIGKILVCRDSNGSYRGCKFKRYVTMWRELKGYDKSIFQGCGCVKDLEFYNMSFDGVISYEDYLISSRGLTVKCKFNDCGWCYCESGKSNDHNGACNKPEECYEYKIQIEERKDD